MSKIFRQHSEDGQSIVIMVFGLIVLVAIMALAIDGGRAYTERRKAQNTADAAAMAAARELGSGASSLTARTVAYETALKSGYSLNEGDITIIDHPLNYGGSYDTGKTESYEVSVFVDSGVDAAFAQIVYDRFLDVNASSNMEVRLAQTPLAGFGIVSLSTSCSGNSNGAGVGVGGGGNSGGIALYGSTIIINAPDPNDNCSFSPPTSTGNDGIYTYDIGPNGELITSTMFTVGTYDCALDNACDLMSPTTPGFNGGVPVSDPLANLPTPTCIVDHRDDGEPADEIYTPGIWWDRDLNEGRYQPGIYCVQRASGGSSLGITGGMIDASSGVLFYLQDTGDGPPDIDFGGSGSFDLRAPGNGTELRCNQGDDDQPESLETMDRTNPCNYRGMALFVDRGTASNIELSGNGTYDFFGTLYGANAIFSGSGGGSDSYEIKVWGQVLMGQVLNNGSGSLQVWYDTNLVYSLPPYINALD